MREGEYQTKLIKRLRTLLPGCIVLKQDANYVQGIPDLLILHKLRWAALEVKMSHDAETQPNQQYYVELLDELSFAAFIFPENEEEVLDAVQRALEPRRSARVSKR